jgi:hypothetical protein
MAIHAIAALANLIITVHGLEIALESEMGFLPLPAKHEHTDIYGDMGAA